MLVSFFIIDAGQSLQGGIPHFTLAQLPIREGKALHMIAWKEPQNDLVDRVRATFPKISSTFSQDGHGEGDYTLFLSGFRAPDSAYMVLVPAKYTPPAPERAYDGWSLAEIKSDLDLNLCHRRSRRSRAGQEGS